ncbi:Cytochrome P450 [Drechslerella dactyloides]|uniref:Cytochrome P450 n=1 Tax=Drechslerella dactyloides TaxID=74499 RepID=A0AAD6NJ85_DREDA|nr:Cytochrome P450 [Drechslerella dactyloides]
MKVLGVTTIVTREPRNMQALLTNQFQDFALGPSKNDPFRPLMGDAILTVDGHRWKYSRALFRPQLTKEKISQLDGLEELIGTMLDMIPNGAAIDLQSLFFELTMDNATQFFFGK